MIENAAIVLQARMGSRRLPGKTLALHRGALRAGALHRAPAGDVGHAVSCSPPPRARKTTASSSRGIGSASTVVRGPDEDVLGRFVMVASMLSLTDVVARDGGQSGGRYRRAAAGARPAPPHARRSCRRARPAIWHGSRSDFRRALLRSAELTWELEDREHVTLFLQRDPRFVALRPPAPDLHQPAGFAADRRYGRGSRSSFAMSSSRPSSAPTSGSAGRADCRGRAAYRQGPCSVMTFRCRRGALARNARPTVSRATCEAGEGISIAVRTWTAARSVAAHRVRSSSVRSAGRIYVRVEGGNPMSGHVLVTGGAGYLGSILCEHLLDAGFSVTVLDNLMYGQQSLFHLCANPAFDFMRRRRPRRGHPRLAPLLARTSSSRSPPSSAPPPATAIRGWHERQPRRDPPAQSPAQSRVSWSSTRPPTAATAPSPATSSAPKTRRSSRSRSTAAPKCDAEAELLAARTRSRCGWPRCSACRRGCASTCW